MQPSALCCELSEVRYRNRQRLILLLGSASGHRANLPGRYDHSGIPNHPISRGGKELTLHDEPYINNNFGGDKNQLASNFKAKRDVPKEGVQSTLPELKTFEPASVLPLNTLRKPWDTGF